MKKAKKAAVIVLSVIALWACLFAVDFIRVNSGNAPVFCVETDVGCYSGLGYSYSVSPHLVTGKQEYELCILGCPVVSTFTN